MKAFEPPAWVDAVGGFVERHPRLLRRLADLESRALRDRLAALPLKAPVYVAGLARAGTTILLEALAVAPGVGSHQYRDFPLVQLPFFWNWLLGHIETREVPPAERAHGDRIKVTPRSPEAMEEVVWRSFFPAGAGPGRGDVFGADFEHPEFERFYREHVGKVLVARGASRYLAKGNYNVTRLGCLRRIFPDARLLVPVRAPVAHVVSCMRQHRRFSEGLRDNPRGRAHLRRVGHFEFGPDRRPIDVGGGAGAEVAALWASGEEARGWARLWAQVYGHVADLTVGDPLLAAAVRVVRFEDFCSRPLDELRASFSHARLDAPEGLLERFAAGVSAPDYYDAGLGEADRAAIREETDSVAARFGYK